MSKNFDSPIERNFCGLIPERHVRCPRCEGVDYGGQPKCDECEGSGTIYVTAVEPEPAGEELPERPKRYSRETGVLMNQVPGRCNTWSEVTEDANGDEVDATEFTAYADRMEALLGASQQPADWFVDSSLETWFPITAEILKDSQQQVRELQKRVADFEYALKSRDKQLLEYHDEVNSRGGKISELQEKLKRSNAGFEEYERKFYLTQDRAELVEEELKIEQQRFESSIDDMLAIRSERDALKRRVEEAAGLFSKLVDSREYRIYIGDDSTFGNHVRAWFAPATEAQALQELRSAKEK